MKKTKIVYSYYVIDILHKGHISHMKNAKIIAGKDGISIVGILTDKAVMEKKERPIISFEERMDIAKIIKYNDIVVPQTTYSPIPNLLAIKPNIHLESTSHNKNDINKIIKVMKSIGGEVIIMPYYPSQSSTNIKQKIKEEE